MRQSILLMFLFICSIMAIGQSKESNELFSQGVELYNQQKYKEAIEKFNQCKDLDELELDSLDVRKEYTKEWIAHCYYKLSDVQKANQYEVFDFILEPVDRALTIEADSLFSLAKIIASNGNLSYAIDKFCKGLELAESRLGKHHCAVANLHAALSTYYMANDNIEKADSELKLAKQIFKDEGYESCYTYGRFLLYEAELNLRKSNVTKCLQLAKEAYSRFKNWDNANYEELVRVYYCLAMCNLVPDPNKDAEKYVLLLEEELKKIKAEEIFTYQNQFVLCCQGLFAFSHFDDALSLLNVSLDFVKEHSWLDGNNSFYINLLYIRAKLLQQLNQLDNALADVKTLITACENTRFFDRNLLDEHYNLLANIYFSKNDPQHQLEAAKKAYMLASSRKDDRRFVKANAKSLMASANYILENKKEAIANIKETIVLLEQLGLENSRNYAWALSLKAQTELVSNPSLAIVDLEKSILILERQALIDYSDLTQTKLMLCALYKKSLMEEEANKTLDEIDEIANDTNIPINIRERILINLYSAKGEISLLEDPTKALEYYKQAKCLAKKYEGFDTSFFEMQIAQSYARSSNFRKATSIIDSLLLKLEDSSSRKLQYANALVVASFVYGSKGDVQKVREYQDLSIKLFGEIYGKHSLNYVGALTSAAYQLSNLGLSMDAYPLCKEAEKIALTHVEPDDPNMNSLYSCLQKVELSVGNIDKAIDYGQKARALVDKNASPIAFCEILCGLSSCYNEKCQYNEAISLLNEAMAIAEKRNGRFNHLCATIFLQYAKVYQTMGNYSEARTNQNVFCEIIKRLQDKTHPEYAMALMFEARQKEEEGDLSNALRCVNEALAIYENSLGETNPVTLEARTAIAQLASKKGDISEAINELEAIYKLQQKSNFYNINVMHLLATSYSMNGGYKLQKNIAESMLNISRRKYGKGSLQEGNAYLHLATAYFFLGNISKSAEYSTKVFDIYRKTLLNNFLFMTKNERANLWNSGSSFFMSYIPMECAYTENHEVFSPLTYNSALLSKGLLLQAETNISDLIYNSGSASIKDEYNHFLNTKNMYNRATASYSEDVEEEEMIRTQCIIDSLANEIDKLEHSLMQHISSEFGDYTSKLATTWKDVRNALGSTDMAIEFLNVAFATDSVKYFALILTKETKEPIYINLFGYSELNKYHNFKSLSDSEMRDLSALLWKPILSRYPDKKNIYFSPCGDLFNIPIESLPSYDKDTYLSEEDYRFYRLSSTRELTAKYKRWNRNSISLYGDVKYDASIDALVDNYDKYKNSTSRSANYVDFLDNNDKNERGIILTPLPGTRAEVDSIVSLISVTDSLKMLAQPYVGFEASEASIKALSNHGERVVHIATHGFFYPQSKVSNSKYLQSIFSNEYDGIGSATFESVEDAALLRCGLYMAGAKNRLKGIKNNEIDDGILTAKEISMINFNGLDLVVLSACETGIGDVTGEGVFGLQRGFKKAGTHSILMSLWKVDDNATSFLMKEFYKKWLSGSSKQESLEYAKEQVRKHKEWNAPRFWAAFVLLDSIDNN